MPLNDTMSANKDLVVDKMGTIASVSEQSAAATEGSQCFHRAGKCYNGRDQRTYRDAAGNRKRPDGDDQSF